MNLNKYKYQKYWGPKDSVCGQKTDPKMGLHMSGCRKG